MSPGDVVRIVQLVLANRVTAGQTHPATGDMGRLRRIEYGNGQIRYIVESIARDDRGVAAAWVAEFAAEELESPG